MTNLELGIVQKENGYYICPSHKDTGEKYRLKFNKQTGWYECTGQQWVKVGIHGTHIAQPCFFQYWPEQKGTWVSVFRNLWLSDRLWRAIVIFVCLSAVANLVAAIIWTVRAVGK